MAVPSHVRTHMGIHRQVQYLLNAMFGPGDGTNTRALLFGAGTAADPVTTSEADKTFIEYWTEVSATSGDTRLAYLSLKMSGAGGFGDTIRVINTVNATTGIENADAIHATQTFSTTATHVVAGQAQAIRATLAAAKATRVLTGKLAALLVDSYIEAGNTVPLVCSFIRAVDVGAVSIPNLFSLAVPGAKDSGDMFLARHADATATHGIQMCDEAGTNYWIMVTTDTPAN